MSCPELIRLLNHRFGNHAFAAKFVGGHETIDIVGCVKIVDPSIPRAGAIVPTAVRIDLRQGPRDCTLRKIEACGISGMLPPPEESGGTQQIRIEYQCRCAGAIRETDSTFVFVTFEGGDNEPCALLQRVQVLELFRDVIGQTEGFGNVSRPDDSRPVFRYESSAAGEIKRIAPTQPGIVLGTVLE